VPISPEKKARYPKDWKYISEYIRFKRAQEVCECKGECGTHREPCKARHGWPHPVTNSEVILTTAHLNPPIENCSYDNLKAMCQRCHLNYDIQHHINNRRENARDKQTIDMFPTSTKTDAG